MPQKGCTDCLSIIQTLGNEIHSHQKIILSGLSIVVDANVGLEEYAAPNTGLTEEQKFFLES